MGLQDELTVMQPVVMKIFSKSVRENRLSHGYLLEGASGTGKKRTALWLAQSLFCLEATETELACGECANCTRIASHNHPDVHLLEPDGASIKIDQVRALKQELSKRGMESDRKVVIIYDAEKMTVQSANSLLKFIEEPEGGLLLLFLTTNPAQILPTIQSRLQPVTFKSLTFDSLVDSLTRIGISEQKARIYASITGSTEQAKNFEEDEWFGEARSAVVKLYEGLHHQGTSPLIIIQESWMPLFKEKDKMALGLELLLLLYRDRLHLTLDESYEPICTAQKEMLAQDALRKSLSETTGEIEKILAAKSKLASNMNMQLLMEQLVLEIQGR
ncbi:DNA polymerase III subunit delta' [Listeria seeligeri]|uniref:DNA polymerase III subunit delta n=2 Tax=Listeria seeligeri TaxID=1640 RepID=A0A7X1C6U3_LISSE|nr:DNA polymerase III subunit delta' [Listeria seeligeri]EFS01529.1 DNA polymerase III subunit delta' [Listeria seeligeri FSL N1-067]KKD46228.1 DNA polymerase III subunit delta' [Listeria seeligeri]MBC1486542.1 DNA polymerase III subunit delta' [Listeria seeligeri]MBC1577931.1 DNA polymerase III subunit delta' [Listeria seeligeri]MBC1586218.1 DNA polymerase III subunit delta' [Listeria seeligeri]